MKNISNLHKLNNIIDKFWSKYSQSRDEFALIGNGEDSYLFIEYHKAYKLCKKILKKKIINENELLAVLELMAIDNENQIVQSYCIDLLNELNQEKLIKLSLHYKHFHSRWLIADLVGQLKNQKFEKYLNVLISDKNKYVQRRAILALENINKNNFENILFEHIADSDGYNRYIYLKCLKEMKSKHLDKAIQLLKNDENEHVIKELNSINSDQNDSII